ncbi:MAG: BON domain-containing protein [Moraxellaceae bacterium]|nr:BON domain-containing protein [Pseudobdellovibrionaceae bacterium]
MQNKRYGQGGDNRYSTNQREANEQNQQSKFRNQDYGRNASEGDYDQFSSSDYPASAAEQDYFDGRQRKNYSSNFDDGRIQTGRGNGSLDHRSDTSKQAGYSSPYPSGNYDLNSSQSWSPQSHSKESLWESAKEKTKSFFGKGPKGFKRSDERIKDDVCEALYHDHAVDATDIEVSVKDSEVTLSGTVSERRMKRVAEDCAESVTGVSDVRNEIRVHSQTDKTFGSSNTSIGDQAQDRSDKAKNRTAIPNKVM